MSTLEEVEKLKKYGNVSYEDAKIALEKVDGDMLEAVIYLEKLGKINQEKQENKRAFYDEYAMNEESKGQCSYYRCYRRERKKSRKLLRKGFSNCFEVEKRGEIIATVPVIVLVIALIFFFWITLPIMALGLMFGCSYRFQGPAFEERYNKKDEDLGACFEQKL